MMKPLVAVALSLFSATIASANPEIEARSDERPTPPTAYVGVSAGLGGGSGGFYGDTGLEGGFYLNQYVAAHGSLVYGGFSDLSEAVGDQSTTHLFRGDANYGQARAGVESRLCSFTQHICGLAGLDLGVLATGSTTGPTTDTMPMTYRAAQAIPRLGIETGGRRVRVRFTAEEALGVTWRSDGRQATGAQDVMLTSSLLVQL